MLACNVCAGTELLLLGVRYRTNESISRTHKKTSKHKRKEKQEQPTHEVVVVVVLGQVADVAVARHDGFLVGTCLLNLADCGRYVFAGWVADK
jgi:hypothetical protein